MKKEVLSFVDMSIVDEFVNAEKLEDVIYFLAERMQRQAKTYTKKVFKEHGYDITIDQWLVLKKISEEPGISQVDIAHTTFKDPAAVTRILDILVRKNLVERRMGQSDRRIFEIFLSAEGEQLIEGAMPLIYDIRAKGLEGLSKNQLQGMKSGLKKMYENLIAE